MEFATDTDRLAYLKNIISVMPEKPGSYQYYDKDGVIIYVGKAKNLKRRVSSYFNKNLESARTRILVSKIRDIKYTVVRTEEDALNLENKLIKQFKPRYNVLLKDDKTYPSIAIQKSEYPQVFKTRQRTRKGAKYFGPYTRVSTMYALLELIKHLYPIRTCRLNLTEEKVRQGKFKVCLEYHLGNCLGPCVGKQSREAYLQNIREIEELLKGNNLRLEKDMLAQMKRLSDDLKFEEAEVVKKRYLLLKNYNARSEVVNYKLDNIDVFSIEETEDRSAFINFMHVANGGITQSYTFEYKKRMDERPEELLALGISEMWEQFGTHPVEIIVPFQPDIEFADVVVTVPQRGDKKKLLELSLANAREYRADKAKMAEKLNPEQRATKLLTELQNLLHLPRLPMRIECFDNSNIQGSDAVAGCVVFVKAKPSKKDYRKYIIKTVTGPDDYASMKEVVRRRYTRALDEEQPLPDLIITDGGKGQMSAVKEVVDELGLDIPIAGLAKDDRHRTSELIYGFPYQTIGVKPDSALFKFLTAIQDEVHRYAITFHRQKRSKHQTASELDQIKGIGEKTRTLLLKTFKSVERIRHAGHQELADVVGEAKARLLETYFQNAASE